MSATESSPSPPSSASSRPELERKYRALVELERRYREAPLLYSHRLLANHPKQRAFLDAGKTHRVRAAFGGNRSGKTWVGAREALNHMYGYRIHEATADGVLQLAADGDLPPRELIPPRYWVRRTDGIPVRVPNVGLVVTGLPRMRGIGLNVFPTLHDALPAGVRASPRLRVMRSAMSVPEWMELPNGSRAIFGSSEQDPITYEGFVADWAWFDEPPLPSIYTAVILRLFDNCGSRWLTLTPLDAKSAWLIPIHDDPPPDTFIVDIDMADNPANPPEKIREIEENGEMDEREKMARLHGQFGSLADRVFRRFDPAVHVVKSFPIPKHWVRGLTVDPHHRRPPFMLWWAFDPEERAYHFYKEYPAGGNFHKLRDGGLTPIETATIIRNAEGDRPAHYRVCDPRFGKAEHIRHGYAEASWVDLMAQLGLHFDARVPNVGDVDRGHAVVDSLLGYDKNFPVSPTNRPRLLVHEGCESLILSFMRYAHLDVNDPIKGIFRKVSEEYKDPIDCVRYSVLWPIPASLDEVNTMRAFSEKDLADNNDY